MTALLSILYCRGFLRLLKARLRLWRLRDNSRNPSGRFCATNSPESCLEGTPRGSLKRRAGGSTRRVVLDRRVGSLCSASRRCRTRVGTRATPPPAPPPPRAPPRRAPSRPPARRGPEPPHWLHAVT